MLLLLNLLKPSNPFHPLYILLACVCSRFRQGLLHGLMSRVCQTTARRSLTVRRELEASRPPGPSLPGRFRERSELKKRRGGSLANLVIEYLCPPSFARSAARRDLDDPNFQSSLQTSTSSATDDARGNTYRHAAKNKNQQKQKKGMRLLPLYVCSG